MDWRTGAREAIEEFRHHRLRTFLTLLGMIFGVGAVVSMLAVGAGARREALRAIETLGTRVAVVEERLTTLGERVATFEEKVEARFSGVEGRIAALEEKVVALAQDVAVIRAELGLMKWMHGITIGGVLALLIKAFFG